MNIKRFFSYQNVLLLLCSGVFFSHLGFIVFNNLCPNETLTRFEERKLDDIEFPVDFKICIFPSIEKEILKSLGYKNTWYYFLGQSIHNGNIYGWAGHQDQYNYSVTGTSKSLLK